MFLADGRSVGLWVELVVSVAISLLSLLLYICYPFPVSICRFVEYPLCFPYIPMGPPDLRTLVTQQTDQVRSIHHTHFAAHIDLIPQITTLTSQLEASFAFNANLNTRLLTALDTLDTLQAELDAERRRNDKHLWVHLIQELQREKEEMKEAVESLIKKGKCFILAGLCPLFRLNPLRTVSVERSNGNFSRWPSAKMYLPTPAGKLSHKFRVLI